jgi:hypothetical protein
LTTSNNGLPGYILEALAKLKLTSSQQRVLYTIWLHQSEPISGLDITRFTGIHESLIRKDLRELVSYKIVNRQFDDTKGIGRGMKPLTSVNTNISEWTIKGYQDSAPLGEKGITTAHLSDDKGALNSAGVRDKGTQDSAPLGEKGITTAHLSDDKGALNSAGVRDKGTQDSAPLGEKGITTAHLSDEKGTHPGAPLLDNNSAKKPSEQAVELANLLRSLILRNNPKSKAPDLTKWAVDVDRMMNIDNRTPEEIKSVIEFCQNDDFWQVNILSTSKLREKFDQLYLKMKKGGSYGTNQRYTQQTRLPEKYTPSPHYPDLDE